MTIKIRWWCDSGANIHSCLRDETTVDELGFTDEEWSSLPKEKQEEIMKDIALERLDWGWVTDEED